MMGNGNVLPSIVIHVPIILCESNCFSSTTSYVASYVPKRIQFSSLHLPFKILNGNSNIESTIYIQVYCS